MSSQPIPPPQSGGEPHNGEPNDGGFFAWLRSLGISRSTDRWCAGVAAGLAARAGVDPLIVRGVFIALALVGGPALLIYAACWLLLPGSTGRIHLEDMLRGRADSWVVTVSVIIGLALVLPTIFLGINATGLGLGLSFGSWGVWNAWGVPAWLSATLSWLFWTAIIIAVVLWARQLIIKRGRSQAGASPQQPDTAPDSAASEQPPQQPQQPADWTQRLSDQAARFSEKAEAWGSETGERVDAWSARVAAEHDARKLGAGHALITVALALLAAGISALITLNSGFHFPTPGATAAALNPPLVAAFAAALAVLAVSLIVAGARGRRTGIVGFLAWCGVIALLITAVLPWGMKVRPFGNMQVTGTDTPGAVNIFGNLDLDLSDLDSSNIPDSGTGFSDLELWQLAGEVTVTLPTTAPTVVEVRLLAGRVQENSASDQTVSGPFISHTVAVNLPATSTPANANHVTVYVAAGTVELNHPDPTTPGRLLLKETNQ